MTPGQSRAVERGVSKARWYAMGAKRRTGPKGSENLVGKWLRRVGVENIEFVGDDEEGGPPDYIATFSGEEVAVEATLLNDPAGWGKTKEIAFEEHLCKVIEEEGKKDGAPKWHASVSYDPRQPIPLAKQWVKNARNALRMSGPGGKRQLVPRNSIVGRGVTLELIPASGQGNFSEISVDEGDIVAPTLAERISKCVNEKADKVRSGKRSKDYDQWWLVLEDEVLIAPFSALTETEREEVKMGVQECADKNGWSKIVLVSRFHNTSVSCLTLSWYSALWENSAHPPLPRK